MTDHPVRSEHFSRYGFLIHLPLTKAAIGTICVALALSGCAERKRPALPWPTASVVHPKLPPEKNSRSEIADAEVPELQPDLAAPSSPFAAPVPRRPRVVVPQPAASEPSKPQAPFVAPQLSVAESSTAQQDATVSLAAAENGLDATKGKTLNAAQTDMVSKIRGFMD